MERNKEKILQEIFDSINIAADECCKKCEICCEKDECSLMQIAYGMANIMGVTFTGKDKICP
jgi:hypothetical protein